LTQFTQKIYKQALDLPTEERLLFIDKLLQSTNLPTQSEIDRAWSREAAKRAKEIDNGTVSLIPGEEVFEKVKKRFSK